MALDNMTASETSSPTVCHQGGRAFVMILIKWCGSRG